MKRYFGHDAFRPGQEQLVDALLSGRDVLGVMPTGAGKSMCYQLPALALPGLTLVISPLISLMKDQVAALEDAGIPAAFLNSTLDGDAYRAVLRGAAAGAYRLLYVAPERLEAEAFCGMVSRLPIALVAVDEAHCVSQWGQDFRPSYRRIAAFVESLPQRPPVGAFTATATAQVREDIIRLLHLKNPLCATTGFDRPNLRFDVIQTRQKLPQLLALLARFRERSGIVYCATRATVERVCEELRGRGFQAARYHAGLEDGERRENQEDFVYDRARIMVATNAFGMGIDKSNVGFVIHYNMPKNLESYYQEAGRAGRDGTAADCVLLFSPGDVQTARFLICNGDEAEPMEESARQELLLRELARLDRMVGYCKTTACLRAYLLEYFGEMPPKACGSCGNCSGPFQERDITTEAQKILSCVVRAERQLGYSVGLQLILQTLRGSRTKRVLQLGLDRLPTYGILSQTSRDQLQRWADRLLELGYMIQTPGEYPVLRLTAAAGDVLFRGKAVTVQEKLSLEPEASEVLSTAAAEPPIELSDDLLELLRALRTRLAQEAGVPAYIVFSNATLQQMAARQPRTAAELLAVPGVGAVKAERYGHEFLTAIRRWCTGEEASY
ncbi:MAG: DNA helicase RecQ [Oscillospiraceae bacterium]|nr:DNA helicase RecQ [Oscillospiraceae bacterium]